MILHKGNCLDFYKTMKPGSVDLILMDPPFGTMDTDGGRKLGINGWDKPIKPVDIFEMANYVLRKNGKLILFAQEPYTTALRMGALPNTPFLYRMEWVKDNFANALGCKQAPVQLFEDVLVFKKQNPIHDTEFTHPLRSYFKEVFEFIGETKKSICGRVGQRADHVFRFNSSQFSLCTAETYQELICAYGIELMIEFKEFEELESIDVPFKKDLNQNQNAKYPSVFNLWEGGKYKSNLLEYKKDYTGLHPTQKPVALLVDLVKTFSNPGDTVVDFTMGSGSTGEACEVSGRVFIGCEMSDKYYRVAEERLGYFDIL